MILFEMDAIRHRQQKQQQKQPIRFIFIINSIGSHLFQRVLLL